MELSLRCQEALCLVIGIIQPVLLEDGDLYASIGRFLSTHMDPNLIEITGPCALRYTACKLLRERVMPLHIALQKAFAAPIEETTDELFDPITQEATDHGFEFPGTRQVMTYRDLFKMVFLNGMRTPTNEELTELKRVRNAAVDIDPCAASMFFCNMQFWEELEKTPLAAEAHAERNHYISWFEHANDVADALTVMVLIASFKEKWAIPARHTDLLFQFRYAMEHNMVGESDSEGESVVIIEEEEEGQHT